jgi:hypothetical protein
MELGGNGTQLEENNAHIDGPVMAWSLYQTGR